MFVDNFREKGFKDENNGYTNDLENNIVVFRFHFIFSENTGYYFFLKNNN